jgi:hypothetical protein
MKRLIMRVGIVSMTLQLVACTPEQQKLAGDWVKRDSIRKVTAELVQTPSKIDLHARFNPWGGGILVYGSQAGDADGTRYVWISLQATDVLHPNHKIPDDLFTVRADTADVTPQIPQLRAASERVRISAGLTLVAWDEIVKYLETGSPPRAR